MVPGRESEVVATRLATLQQLASELAGAMSFAELARVILRSTVPAVEAAAASLWEREGRRLRLIDQLGAASQKRYLDYVSLDVASPLAVAIETGMPQWIPDRATYEASYPMLAALAGPYRTTEALAVLPLAANGEPTGVLVYAYPSEKQLDDAERAFLTALAHHAAAAFERARLYQREATTALRLAKLQEATAALASARTPAEVAAATVLHGSEAVGAQSGMLWLCEPDGELRARALHGLPVHYAAQFAVLPATGELPPHRVIATREPLWVETAADFAREAPALYDAAADAGRITAFAMLPLEHDGEAIGAVGFGYATERTITAEERRFLRTLGRACEQSLERAKLYVEADAANRAKDSFLALLGHELRNPLAPIVTAIDLLRARGAKFEREIGVIDRQVQHLIGLVDDLLDISRITRGRIELDREVVELRDAVTAAVERAQPLIDKMHHVIDIRVPAIRVDADRGRLVQALANPVTNAAQYTPPGGRIEIAAETDTDHAIVRVRDNGTGIPPELMPALFEVFSQGERSVDRAQGGLGLGLAIAKNLIEQHGGAIAGHSDGIGRGAEVTVRWPLARVGVPRAAPAARAAPTGKPLRVLVVDDNIIAAELLGDILRYMGHEPIVVHDGASALAQASLAGPDVALVDIGLPVLDGYELATRLRALPQLAATRLIALTGYDQPSDREKSARAGFDEHLAKPIDQVALAALLGTTAE